jgi:hypothetical protein
MEDIDIFDGYYDEECICQEQLYGTGDTWIGQYQKHYKLGKMETRHIRNCIRMLQRKLVKEEDSLESCCVYYIESRIQDLKNELNKRRVKC